MAAVMTSTRPSAVAGSFYPADPVRLRQQVVALLGADARGDGRCPKALIVPHAGYVYSGPVAGRAYALLAPFAARIRRVVLLGPAHRVAVRGLAAPSAERFATPLGDVAIDAEALGRLRALPQVSVSDTAHAMEHSLEVHLPFLQAVLPDFRLLPLVVGEAAADEVAEVLDRVWGGEETLIVISSDLSHYLPYAEAQRTDHATAQSILRMDATLDPFQACGAYPINGLLRAASRRGLQASLIDLRNSGDTAGDRSRVVGYAAFAFTPDGGAKRIDDDGDEEDHGETLLSTARGAIGEHFGMPLTLRSEAARLRAHGASFVTLTMQGELRGCIGSLEAVRPLLEDVRRNARAAAFADPRFPPLSREEFGVLRVEVSVLSRPEAMSVDSEDDALRQMRPGVDGLVLSLGHLRSTFLPQVWEQLPDATSFLRALKRKAGLPGDFWSSGMQLARYTVTKYREQDIR